MKNKYSELSDYEINKRVAEYHDFGDLYPEFNDRSEIVYLCDIWDGPSFPVSTFYPCEDFEDAMPVVIENNINLHMDMNTAFIQGKFSARNENIMRAAMEVFLMMKETENE